MRWLRRLLGLDTPDTRPGASEGSQWDAVRPLLRPVLRGVTLPIRYPQTKPPLRRPAMPYLAELVVIDQPDAMRYVSAERLEEWGVSAATVFDTARQNLAKDLRQPVSPPPEGASMIRFVDDGDAYWTSYLLLDGWLEGLAGRVGGRPVAFAPDRHTLIIVPDQAELLHALFQMIEADYLRESMGISPVAYVSDDNGRTVPYDAPPGHPLHHWVRRSERILAGREYAHQHAAFAGSYDGAALVELALVESPGGSVVTTANWPQAGSVLLPRTDFVAFLADPSTPQFVVPWPEVIEHVPLRPAEGLDPARYRADRWPSDEVLAELRAAAVPGLTP